MTGFRNAICEHNMNNGQEISITQYYVISFKYENKTTFYIVLKGLTKNQTQIIELGLVVLNFHYL